MEKLIGQRIDTIMMSGDKEYIAFINSENTNLYHADGDCCSYSWVQSIEGVENLLGATVLEVEEIDIGCIENHPEHECLQMYGIKFKTDRGNALLEFRNSSNGYYGGWLCSTTLSDTWLNDLSKTIIVKDFS